MSPLDLLALTELPILDESASLASKSIVAHPLRAALMTAAVTEGARLPWDNPATYCSLSDSSRQRAVAAGAWQGEIEQASACRWPLGGSSPKTAVCAA